MADTGSHVPCFPPLQVCSGTYTAPPWTAFPPARLLGRGDDPLRIDGTGLAGDRHGDRSSPGSVTFSYVSQGRRPAMPTAGDHVLHRRQVQAALYASGNGIRDATTNTLYLWTPTGDSPANHVVEAKARTYGFELSGLSYVNIRGINLLRLLDRHQFHLDARHNQRHQGPLRLQLRVSVGRLDALDAAHGGHRHYHPGQRQHAGKQRDRLSPPATACCCWATIRRLAPETWSRTT